MNLNLNLSIITDEISQDPAAAIKEGINLGLRRFELRTVFGQRLPDGAGDTVPLLQRLRFRHGISYTALSPGLFKCEPDDTLFASHLHDKLESAIAVARTLDIPVIVCFAGIDHDVHRPAELREAALPWLKRAAARIAEAGLLLAVETEYMSGCETGADAAELVREIGSAAFGVNWDVANAWIAGEDPLAGYRHVRESLFNVHIKDADTRNWQARNPFVVLGDGHLPWKMLMELFMTDFGAGGFFPSGRMPFMTVETHIEPLVENSRLFVGRLQQIIADISALKEA